MQKIKSAEKELSKAYSPNLVEDKWYPIWEKSNAFKPAENDADSFTLMIPPPYVTGILTIGHVLNISLAARYGACIYSNRSQSHPNAEREKYK